MSGPDYESVRDVLRDIGSHFSIESNVVDLAMDIVEHRAAVLDQDYSYWSEWYRASLVESLEKEEQGPEF